VTAAQRRSLEALEAVSRDGWPATVREVARVAGCSVSTAHGHLVALERQGAALRHPRSERGGWLPSPAGGPRGSYL
jgi:DNA-binding IclR family transcriptional regulator